jgi:hypothetical protein
LNLGENSDHCAKISKFGVFFLTTLRESINQKNQIFATKLGPIFLLQKKTSKSNQAPKFLLPIRQKIPNFPAKKRRRKIQNKQKPKKLSFISQYFSPF